MSAGAVARAYGRALFEAAVEAGQLPVVLSEAHALEEALRTDLLGLLLSPKVPMAQRLGIVREVFDGASPLFLSFLEHVIRKGRAGALPQMVIVLRGLDMAAAGRAVGQLHSATGISDQLKEEIRATMARLTNTDLSLESSQDPGLLGGFVVRVGDRMLDCSLRARLDQLRRHLKAV